MKYKALITVVAVVEAESPEHAEERIRHLPPYANRHEHKKKFFRIHTGDVKKIELEEW